MKYKDYKFSTSSESINLTYKQAYGYLKDTVSLINNSKFDLFNDDEELSLVDAEEKYNEINRRLQSLGQAFELFMKYIIHASRLEKNPNISKDDLWNKWIRGHQMITLINEKANSEEVLTNFKEIFNLAMNSYFGLYGFNLPYHIEQLKVYASRGQLNPVELFTLLQPQTYQGGGALTSEQVDQIIEKNTAVYEKCRYNMQNLTDYNFVEVFNFINFIKFFAKMIYISNNKTQIDYNVAYVHSVIEEPDVRNLLNKIKSNQEIDEILHDDFFNKDARLLSYLLTINNRSLDEIRSIMKMNSELQNPDNLFLILDYGVSIENIKKCNEKGYNVMLLASHFTFDQIEKIMKIPSVGDYLNKNPLLVNRMITPHESDIGLTFDDWYRILNMDEVKERPECLYQIIIKYKENYHNKSKNELCDKIFALPSEANNKKDLIVPRDSKSFSEIYSDKLISNIRNNFNFYKENGIDMTVFPVSIDSENAERIIDLFVEYRINSFALWILTCPFNEVYAVLAYMKKNNYDLSASDFTNEFEKIYDSNSLYDPLLRDRFINDKFILDSGLIRISDQRYCNQRYGYTVSGNFNNPLPNLSGK